MAPDKPDGEQQEESSLHGAATREEEEEKDVRPTDLSELLKEGTRESHNEAKKKKFMDDFQKRGITREKLKLATTAYFYIYEALEEELGKKEHSVIAPLYFPDQLHRTTALKEDLTFFYGKNWDKVIHRSDATKVYVERIHQLTDQPELLVAHAYTRYMGDLSGGQELKEAAQEVLDHPSEGKGVKFYIFDNVTNAQEIMQKCRAQMNTLDLDSESKEKIVEEANRAIQGNIKKFKNLYKARMNKLNLDSDTKKKIVEEANQAFRFNMDLFEELDKIGATIPDEPQGAAGLSVHE